MIHYDSTLSGSINVSGSIILNGQQLTVSLVPIYEDTTPKVLNSTSSIQTLTVTGQNFDGSAIGYVKGNNGTRYDPTTSIRNSDIQLTLNFSGSDRLTSANEPYDVYILNGNGENTFEEDVVNIDASPVWQTPAGNLGTIFAGTYLTSSINISATDPDSNDTVSYFITGGALPAGMALITSSGELTGSSIIPLDIENYNESGIVNNVTIAATDNTSTVIRNFAITKKWLQDGSTAEQFAESALDIYNLTGTTTNGYYYIRNYGSGTPQLTYCDFNTVGGPWTIPFISGVDPLDFSNNGPSAIATYRSKMQTIGIDTPGRGMESSRTSSEVLGAWLAVKRFIHDEYPSFYGTQAVGGVLLMPMLNINGEGGTSDHRLIYDSTKTTILPANQDGDACDANQLFCGHWGGNDYTSWTTDNFNIPGPEDWGPANGNNTTYGTTGMQPLAVFGIYR